MVAISVEDFSDQEIAQANFDYRSKTRKSIGDHAETSKLSHEYPRRQDQVAPVGRESKEVLIALLITITCATTFLFHCGYISFNNCCQNNFHQSKSYILCDKDCSAINK